MADSEQPLPAAIPDPHRVSTEQETSNLNPPSAPQDARQTDEAPSYKIPHSTHLNAYTDDTSMTDPNSMQHAVAQHTRLAQDKGELGNEYSGRHHIPTVQGYEQDRQRRMDIINQQHQDEQEAALNQGPELSESQPSKQDLNEEQQKEKQELMKRLAPGKKDKPNKLSTKGARMYVPSFLHQSCWLWARKIRKFMPMWLIPKLKFQCH